MHYAAFGNTGLKTSAFCLGTMGMGSPLWKGWVLDERNSVPILKRALDAGINFFDMADWYSAGINEQIVGRSLLSMMPRDRLVLATKVFYPMSDDPNDRGLSRKHLLASIDRSLRQMGTDYVDLYIIHAFDPHTPIEETMETLHDIVKSGKVRYTGASTMYAWQFAKMNHVADLHGWVRFVNMQCQYSLLYREEEREMMPYCHAEGIAVTSFSPLARGFLAGGATALRALHDPYLEWFGDAIDGEIARRVGEVAAERGKTASQIAQAWVHSSRNVGAVLIGAESAEHVDMALEATQIILTDEERGFLEETYRPRDVINDYNALRRPRAL